MRSHGAIKRRTIPVRREREENLTLRCDCSSKKPTHISIHLTSNTEDPKRFFLLPLIFSFESLSFSPTRYYLHCDQLSQIPFSKDLATSACSLEKTLLTIICWWIPSWQLWLSIVQIKIRNPLYLVWLNR